MGSNLVIDECIGDVSLIERTSPWLLIASLFGVDNERVFIAKAILAQYHERETS
jgi:hypothetical protein